MPQEFVGPPAPPMLEEALNEVQQLNNERLGRLEQAVLGNEGRFQQNTDRLVTEVGTRGRIDEQMASILGLMSDRISFLSTLASILLVTNLVLAVAVIRLYRRLKK